MSAPVWIICRQASDYQVSANDERGHHCAECGREVWLSQVGRDQLRTTPNAKLMCNPCGFAQVEKQRGNIGAVGFNPAAIRQFRRRERN